MYSRAVKCKPSPHTFSDACCSFRLPDGLTRRGDINLLMLGDPGTAKSQLLKFVERCSPIGVNIQPPMATQYYLFLWLVNSNLVSLRSHR